MISETITRRYAKALFAAAEADGQREALGPFLLQLQELLREHSELRAMLVNPGLPDTKKLGLLLRLLGDTIPPLLERFLSLILAKRRLGILEAAGTIFGELMDEAAGIKRAQVVTPLPLTDEQQQRLAEALSRRLASQVVITPNVDPALIGGVKVTVGDLLIDGTIRHRLDQVRERFSTSRLGDTQRPA